MPAGMPVPYAMPSMYIGGRTTSEYIQRPYRRLSTRPLALNSRISLEHSKTEKSSQTWGVVLL